jgi:16S rRNA (guanine527-N7)-methyltransferase
VTKQTRGIADALARGLGEFGLDQALAAPLADYIALLARWNRAYNLTSVRDPEQMVTRHVLDCLAVLPVLDALALPKDLRLLDVGAGAGLPGLLLAMARPDWSVTVLDSNGKKARFMRFAARDLGLANVATVQERAERYRPERPFTAIISRAYSQLADFFASTHAALAADGYWLAMKGKLADPEVAQARKQGVRIMQITALQVPGLDEARHLVVARPAGAV